MTRTRRRSGPGLLALLGLLLWGTPAEAATYCSQLEALGLEGKQVAVTSAAGSTTETRQGKLVAIEADVLILDPGTAADEVPPLYQRGEIVQTLTTRLYFNCDHVVSVTVDPLPFNR